MTRSTLIALALLIAPAYAQEPSEEVKKAALMRAYRLNGDSMVGAPGCSTSLPRSRTSPSSSWSTSQKSLKPAVKHPRKAYGRLYTPRDA